MRRVPDSLRMRLERVLALNHAPLVGTAGDSNLSPPGRLTGLVLPKAGGHIIGLLIC